MNEIAKFSKSERSLLASLDRGRTLLEKATTDFERLRVRDHARAAQAAAAILERQDIQVTASTLVQRAERAITQANPPAPLGRGKVVILDNDFSNESLRQMRAAHAKLSDADFEKRVAAAIETQTPLTRASLKPGPHVANNSGNNEWYTPAAIIEAARDCMGGIDLDPASSKQAQETVRAARWFGIDDDGLAQTWAGKVWLNPPYARGLVDRFIEKLLSENVAQACVLVNNATETVWAQTMLSQCSVCFLSGRVKFTALDGVLGAPLQGQMIFGYRVSQGRLLDAFENMGVCK